MADSAATDPDLALAAAKVIDARGVRAWLTLREVWRWVLAERLDQPDRWASMSPDLAQKVREVLGDDPYGTTAIAEGDRG